MKTIEPCRSWETSSPWWPTTRSRVWRAFSAIPNLPPSSSNVWTLSLIHIYLASEAVHILIDGVGAVVEEIYADEHGELQYLQEMMVEIFTFGDLPAQINACLLYTSRCV